MRYLLAFVRVVLLNISSNICNWECKNYINILLDAKGRIFLILDVRGAVVGRSRLGLWSLLLLIIMV